LNSLYIDQAFVTHGDLSKFQQDEVCAIIRPNIPVILDWAKQNGIEENNIESLVKLEPVQKKVVLHLFPSILTLLDI